MLSIGKPPPLTASTILWVLIYQESGREIYNVELFHRQQQRIYGNGKGQGVFGDLFHQSFPRTGNHQNGNICSRFL